MRLVADLGWDKLAAVIAIPFLVSATPPSDKVRDVSKALSFSDVRNCIFSRETEAVFTSLLSFDERRDIWLTRAKVAVGSLILPTRRTVTPREDVVPGGKFYEVSVALPSDARWHGLKITQIRRDQGHYPEIDPFEERQLIFDEPADKVQAVLAQMGVKVPMAPDFHEIGEDGIGAMYIAKTSDRALLGCNWGA